MGLITHLHLINQLSRGLGRGQWLKYDVDYREWAAAKGVRIWGELNLTLYGRCLSSRMDSSSSSMASLRSLGASNPRPKHGEKRSGLPRRGACFQWNLDRGCDRTDCHFLHSCYYCGDHHQVKDCNSAKRSHKEAPGRDWTLDRHQPL